MAKKGNNDAQAKALTWLDVQLLSAADEDVHGLALEALTRGLDGGSSTDRAAVAFFRQITERTSNREAPGLNAAPPLAGDFASSQYRALFDTSPISISITSADEGRIIFVNNTWAASYGRPIKELIGSRISDYYPDPDIRDNLLRRMRTEGFIRNEEVQVNRSGGDELTWILLSIYPIEFEGQSAVLAWIYDIDERKQAEAALRLSQQRLQDFADASADWFWETDEEHRFTYISEGFERATGFNPKDLFGRDRREFIRVSSATSNDPDILKKLDAREPIRDYTHLYPIAGREKMWIRSSSLPIHDQHGNFIGYRGTTTDVTSENETRLRLQSIADRYLNAIDSMSEGVALWDENDQLVVSNRRFQEFGGDDIRHYQTGTTFEGFIRASAEAGTFLESGEALEAAIQERVKAHRHPPSEIKIHRLHRILSIREQRTPDGGTITIAIDMTQQHYFEEQLHQAQKMEAVGQLTGGIAHDFNNLLAVISGNLELLERRAKGDENLTRFIMRGLAAADRGAELTNRLLAFSRRQPLTEQTATLDRLITGMQDLVQRTLGATIQIRTKIAADPWPCEVDVSQLENAILNLAINARDAMPEGGDLTIETTNLDLTDAAAARRHNLPPGRYVTLSVRDTGVGMSAGVVERAFDPFFTTKDVDKGTGLGLSMVYGFVQQSGGQVRIESTVGEGTTVTIYLTRSPETTVPEDKTTSALDPMRGNGEEILVVEDDSEVRDIAVAMLRDLGYRVQHVNEGKSALEKLKTTPDLALLLSDVVLPGGMSGRTLAAAARTILPGLPVLFMSGYAKDAFGVDGSPDPGDALLEKPFRRIDLAQFVRRALSS